MEPTTQIANLIQNTPYVEELFHQLKRKDVLPASMESVFNTVGSRYQKCRRFYDRLLQEHVSMPSSDIKHLAKIFNDTGNGDAAELLQQLATCSQPNTDSTTDSREKLNSASEVSNSLPKEFSRTGADSDSSPRKLLPKICSSRVAIVDNQVPEHEAQPEKLNIYPYIFVAARRGDLCKLTALLEAAKKYKLLTQSHPDKESERDLRDVEEEDPMKKRDWADKTLLHLAVEGRNFGNAMQCIDRLLDYAQEAERKEQLLDAQEQKGDTALHLAIKKESVKMCKKLITEGASLFIRNDEHEYPLNLIYERLPRVAGFLLDKTITTNGDTSSDAFDLNIDFGIIIGFFQSCDKSVAVKGSRVLNDDLELLDFKIKHKECRQNKKQQNKRENREQRIRMISDSGSDKVNQQQSEITSSSEAECFEEMRMLAALVLNNGKACPVILSHPVVKTFLDLKWSKMKFWLHLTSSIQIISYILYVFLIIDIYLYNCPNPSITNKALPKHVNSNDNSTEGVTTSECQWTKFTTNFIPVLLVTHLISFVNEISEALRVRSIASLRVYFCGIGNWMQLLFFAILLITSIPPYFQTSFHSSQYAFATLGILWASALILLLIGNSNLDFVIHSVYIHVYQKVLQRFASVLITFSPLILAFALAFRLAFPMSSPFASYLGSFARLFIMLAGEFNFDEEFYNDQKQLEVNSLFLLGQILYVVFATIITIVLIDVFLGYTVSDIQELKERAEIVQRSIQVEQLFEMEGFLQKMNTVIHCLGIKNGFDIMVVPNDRKVKHRPNVIVSFKEISKALQMEFRKLLNNKTSDSEVDTLH